MCNGGWAVEAVSAGRQLGCWVEIRFARLAAWPPSQAGLPDFLSFFVQAVKNASISSGKSSL